MKKISYSQYSMWAQCPHRWKTAYIDGNREFSDNIHTLFGTSMHEVLQHYLNVMYDETAKKAEHILAYKLPGQVMHAGERLKKYSLEDVKTAKGN